MLRSDLCDYSDAYVAVKGIIIVRVLLQMEPIILQIKKTCP